MCCGMGIIGFWIIIGIAIVWSLIWKAIGLWYSARNNDKVWFIVFLIVNLLGIPPILYLYFRTDFFKKKKRKKK